MNSFIESHEFSVVLGFLGTISVCYLVSLIKCPPSVEIINEKIDETYEQIVEHTQDESNHVINSLTCVIRGEMKNVNANENEDEGEGEDDNENPYDLFTRIYPTIKDMDNAHINEFIRILRCYNTNWTSK